MNSLEKALRYVAMGTVFLLPIIPLIVTNSMYFPYITGKNFAFRAVVEIGFAAALALALMRPEWRPKRSWILGTFALFVLAIAIADAQGVNVFKSFWSNFERMDGWVTLIHLLMYLVTLGVVMTDEVLWRRLFQTTIGVSVLVSILGLLQLGGIDVVGSGQTGLSARIDTTFGNPIYLAVYMLFHVFLAALLWLHAWRARKPGERLAVSVWYGLVVVLDTFALFLTGTRGTMLGIVGGVILSCLILVFFARSSRFAWRAAVASVVGLVVISGGFWAIRDSQWAHSIGFLDRIASISLTDQTVQSRFLNMGIAWQGVKERPILGWGQENYAIVFDKYYDPRMWSNEQWFDRVHDIIFDWLIAGGFVGLFSYLSIFAALLWAIWKGKTFDVGERSILTGLLAAYFFHNLFVFDNITSYILFVTLAGYILWRETKSRGAAVILATWRLSSAVRALLPAGALLLAIVLIWGANAAGYAQNLTLLSALQQQSGGPAQNLALFEKTIGYGAMGTQEAREQLTQIAGTVIRSSGVDQSVRQQYFDTAVREMTAQEAVSPLDARFPLFLGVLFDAAGDYADGKTSLEKALSLSPRKQSILYEVANNAELRGDRSAALAAYKRAFELDEADTDARTMYAAEAIVAGQDSLADSLLAPVIASGQAASSRVAAAYGQRKEYGKLVTIWEAYTKSHPSDAQGYVTLAAGYYGLGERDKAVQALESAKKVSPGSASQIDNLIQQVQSGTAQI